LKFIEKMRNTYGKKYEKQERLIVLNTQYKAKQSVDDIMTPVQNRKFELMRTRRAKAYGSSGSVI